MRRTPETRDYLHGHRLCGHEGPRIERVIAREGREGAKQWARRIAETYRAAVLDPEHFAHTGGRRRQFIEAYLELKRFASSDESDDEETTMPLKLKSPAFAEGSTIPRKYTGDGDNISPPLEWSGAPDGTRSFAVICEDPDAPSGTFRHWAVANIPGDRSGISESARERYDCARNDFGHDSYDGPAPPRGHGLHHYHFKLAALDVDKIDVSADESAEELWRSVEPHVLAQTETIGTYQR